MYVNVFVCCMHLCRCVCLYACVVCVWFFACEWFHKLRICFCFVFSAHRHPSLSPLPPLPPPPPLPSPQCSHQFSPRRFAPRPGIWDALTPEDVAVLVHRVSAPPTPPTHTDAQGTVTLGSISVKAGSAFSVLFFSPAYLCSISVMAGSVFSVLFFSRIFVFWLLLLTFGILAFEFLTVVFCRVCLFQSHLSHVRAFTL